MNTSIEGINKMWIDGWYEAEEGAIPVYAEARTIRGLFDILYKDDPENFGSTDMEFIENSGTDPEAFAEKIYSKFQQWAKEESSK